MISPKDNSVFFGNSASEQLLLSDYRNGTIQNAYIFSGQYGVGKETLAFRFARLLLSCYQEHADSLYIDTSDRVFKQVSSSSTPNLILIKKDKISIEDIRELKEQLSLKVVGRRVIIVDNADSMNESSANSLLKTLEEPPSQSTFILIANNYGSLLPTIRSRCHHITLNPLTESEIIDALDYFSVDTSISKIACGSVGIALQISESGGMEFYDQILRDLKQGTIRDNKEILSNFKLFEYLLFNLFRKYISFKHGITNHLTETELDFFSSTRGNLLDLYEDANKFFFGTRVLSLDPDTVLLWLQKSIVEVIGA